MACLRPHVNSNQSSQPQSLARFVQRIVVSMRDRELWYGGTRSGGKWGNSTVRTKCRDVASLGSGSMGLSIIYDDWLSLASTRFYRSFISVASVFSSEDRRNN